METAPGFKSTVNLFMPSRAEFEISSVDFSVVGEYQAQIGGDMPVGPVFTINVQCKQQLFLISLFFLMGMVAHSYTVPPIRYLPPIHQLHAHSTIYNSQYRIHPPHT